MASPTPYREAPPHAAPRCPLCHAALANPVSATCATCGLWWVLPQGHERLRVAQGSAWEQPALRHLLRTAITPSLLLVPLAMAVSGFGAASLVWMCRASADGVVDGVIMLVGSVIALLVATTGAASFLQQLLHFAVPARLDGDASALRVRVWNTWEGLADGFRRTDVRVPREEITGVGLSTGQWGGSQLFLLHRSGLALGTGWSGSRADALGLVGPIARWVAAPSSGPLRAGGE